MRYFVPAGALILGNVFGLLDALNAGFADWAVFVGLWAGAGLAAAIVAVIPVAMVCALWNQLAKMSSRRRSVGDEFL